jgi:hypothetical protein
MVGLEADPSATGPSEDGRLWRRCFHISPCDLKTSEEEESHPSAKKPLEAVLFFGARE